MRAQLPPPEADAPTPTPPPPGPSRLVLVDVPKGRWWKLPLKFGAFAALCGVTAAVFGYAGFYWL